MTKSFPLEAIINAVHPKEIRGVPDGISVRSLENDSRKVTQGTLFAAVTGTKLDARRFLPAALSSGAVAALADYHDFDLVCPQPLPRPVLLVEDTRLALAQCAKLLFGDPTSAMLTIGITGTNGKTSTAWILAWALTFLNEPAAYIGTLGHGNIPLDDSDPYSALTPTETTTPDSLALHRMIAAAHANGASAVAMEASSHAIDQDRTAELDWDLCLFTNLTRDHLDYHGTLEHYAAAKKRLFTELLACSPKPKRHAVFNVKDPCGADFAQEVRALPGIQTLTFSTDPAIKADACLLSASGDSSHTDLSFRVCGEPLTFHSRLIGGYNAENLLGAAVAMAALGFSHQEIAAALAHVPPVPGRLELVDRGAVQFFIDYAHTPDGLLKAQSSLRPITKQRLITVFGCGGDRDRGKRPLMGQAVAEHSDFAVVTSDNPRTENPQQIINDILPGLSPSTSGRKFAYIVEPDRAKAIAAAAAAAQPGDVILVAGKGHEPYQEICGVRHPFLDRSICQQVTLGNSGTR